MLFRRDIRIGNVSGATGDSPHAMRRIAEDGNVDVIVGDWLSEMNIAWNAIAKDQDPSLGYGPDFLTQLSESIDIIVEKGIKVITIAGALNTPALAARVQEMSRAQGHKEVVIAMVLGDDISQVVTDPATLAVSWSADYFNARGVHSAIFSFIGAISFLASAVLPLDAYLHRYGCLIVATSGAFSCIPPLLGWLSSNLRSTAGIGLAIAMNLSFGAPGQIVGVWIYKSDQAKKGFPTGHWTNAGLLLLASIVCVVLRLYYGWLNWRFPQGQIRYAY